MTAKLAQDKSINAVITPNAQVALVATQALGSAHSSAKLYTLTPTPR